MIKLKRGHAAPTGAASKHALKFHVTLLWQMDSTGSMKPKIGWNGIRRLSRSQRDAKNVEVLVDRDVVDTNLAKWAKPGPTAASPGASEPCASFPVPGAWYPPWGK